jgi:hypothetical protein
MDVESAKVLRWKVFKDLDIAISQAVDGCQQIWGGTDCQDKL